MAKIFYHAVPVDWRKEQKYDFLEKAGSIAGVKWTTLTPDKKQNWLDHGYRPEFDDFMAIGDRDLVSGNSIPPIFSHYSRGIATSRDDTAVNFNRDRLAKNMEEMIDAYNGQVDAYHRLKKKPAKVEDFIDYKSGKISWSRDLKNDLLRHRKVEFAEEKIRPSLYRPFAATSLFFDRVMNEEVYGFPEIFPKLDSKNFSICITDAASEKPFMVLATDKIADLHIVGAGASAQCFPLFHYVEDTNKKKFERRDNITPEALTLFRIFYDDDSNTRENIFHYIYALLHRPTYRTRYAENLKRELPRIPFVGVAAKKDSPASFYPLSAIATMQGDAKPDHNPKASAKLFHAFADVGKKLADLHVNYESAKEFPLKRIENKEVKLDWRVETMKLLKVGTPFHHVPNFSRSRRNRKVRDAVEVVPTASIIYNDFLTLEGIPAETFDYRLGNRSALEWVIDQYRVAKNEQGNLTSDPNRMDDEEYIVRLIGQVITVSLETRRLISTLPKIIFE